MTHPGIGQAILLTADADLLHRPRPMTPDELLTIVTVTVPVPATPDVPHTRHPRLRR